MRPDRISTEYKRGVIEAARESNVRLNGDPATISGSLKDFATVRNNAGLSAEWAWETAAAIVAAGGNFTTV